MPNPIDPQETLEAIANREYDFLDFGASDGKSFHFAQKVLGGKSGLGIDIDSNKIAALQTAGVACYRADITRLDLPENSVRFVIMNHFLEHLPSLEEVSLTLSNAARVASEFIAVQGPYFDADEVLAQMGLRFYWSHWSVHTCHLTTDQLVTILNLQGLHDRCLMVTGEVLDSDDPCLHPLSSPKNQKDYDPGVHESKRKVVFRPPLYREITCLAKTGAMSDWVKLIAKVGNTRNAVPADLDQIGSAVRPPIALQETPKCGAVKPGAQDRILKLARILLIHRGWEYLRYLHLRDALLRASDVRSLLLIGADRGIAGVALSVEFPHIRFRVSDYRGQGNSFCMAKDIVSNWSLTNTSFGGADLLQPLQQKYDFVALCDVLQHIPNHTEVVEHLGSGCQHWMYASMPLAGDKELGVKAKSGHDDGLSLSEVSTMFPGAEVRGCYWRHRGSVLRLRLENLDDLEIQEDLDKLMCEAEGDLIAATPRNRLDALAFSVLAKF